MRNRNVAYYESLYDAIELTEDICCACDCYAVRIERNANAYNKVATQTGVTPVVIALLHMMEADCDMSRQILNGEHFYQKTVLVPVDCGPWGSWEDSAIRILLSRYFMRFADATWTLGWYLEKWNGWGYAKQGKNSPYLVGKTPLAKGSGKYVADGVYDASAETEQVGALVMLKYMLTYSRLCGLVYETPRNIFPINNPSPWPRHEVAEFQNFVNRLQNWHNIPPLLVDGIFGEKTNAAYVLLF